MPNQFLKINGALITQPGIIGKVTHETPTRVKVVIIDLFFPVHDTRWGKSQIDAARQAYFKEIFIGQTRKYWKTGTRANHEVGYAGETFNRGGFVADWHHKHEGASQ